VKGNVRLLLIKTDSPAEVSFPLRCRLSQIVTELELLR